MNQLSELVRRLSWRQRIFLLAAALAIAGGLYQFIHWNQERDFQPLMTGLTAEDAGAITAKLKELGVDYRIREDGGAILAPSARVAELRLQLAAEGLPRTGRIGFELFDKMNFGASEFTEQVNYQRAVEGELERSVMSIREVELARVHITPAKDSLYTESRQPAKASVLVKLKRGGTLTPQNVAAIAQLAASAVPGLYASQVSVLDTNGTLLSRPREAPAADDSSEAALEYRKSVERDLQLKIAHTLDPLLGADHYRAGVSAEVDLTSGDQSEELFDPGKSAVISSQKSEDGPVLPLASGTPGTASNLPNPTSRLSAGTSAYSRKTENLTYQASRVVRHTKLPQGAVQRLSISVLVDHALRWEGEKRMIEPPAPEKLKVIRDLVAAATGLNMERGDQLTVEAFPFQATLNAEPLTPAPAPQVPPAGTLPLPPWLQKLLGQRNVLVLGGIGAGALIVLAAGWYLLGRTNKKKISAKATSAIEGPGAREITAAATGQIEARLAEQAAEHARREAEALASLKVSEVSTKKTEVLAKHIAEEAKNSPAGMAHVVRSWLNGEYQR
jgi:flagellar M-ring protein FliF